jgi:hypothetical protein
MSRTSRKLAVLALTLALTTGPAAIAGLAAASRRHAQRAVAA